MSNPKSTQRGFTIVELMIATAVLSIILLISTVLITRIGDLYYKGINQVRVQNDVRTITSQLSQDLELTNGTTTAGTHNLAGGVPAHVLCIGTTRYTYILNQQIGTPYVPLSGPSGSMIYHVLWRDTPSTCSISSPADLEDQTLSGNGGTELIAPDSRLTAFTVSPASPYSITVGVAFGADDLLNVPVANPANTTCKGNVGDQFCATAVLTTTADQRLQ